jgi:hypothetical protein
MVLPTNTEEERQRNQVCSQPVRVSFSSTSIFKGPPPGSKVGKGKTTFLINKPTNPNYNGFVGLKGTSFF